MDYSSLKHPYSISQTQRERLYNQYVILQNPSHIDINNYFPQNRQRAKRVLYHATTTKRNQNLEQKK
jgi:hypothetical protein